MAERAESLCKVHQESYRVSRPRPVAFLADESDSCSATFIWSASDRSVQHLRVGTDAVDHSEGFSIDLDQCSCFMGEFVTPGAEQSFGEFGFLFAMRESAIVSLLTTLVCEVTWVEPHRGLLVIVTKIAVLIERNISLPHGHHRSDDPSFESSGCVHVVCVQLYQLRMRMLEERIEVFRHAAVSASAIRVRPENR